MPFGLGVRYCIKLTFMFPHCEFGGKLTGISAKNGGRKVVVVFFEAAAATSRGHAFHGQKSRWRLTGGGSLTIRSGVISFWSRLIFMIDPTLNY